MEPHNPYPPPPKYPYTPPPHSETVGYTDREPGSARSRRARRRTSRVLRRPMLNIKGCLSCAVKTGCLLLIPPILISIAIIAVYVLAPFRSNILLLGIDYSDPSNNIARSDTIILTQFDSPDAAINMLSIPRDLWVHIPGVGENRINTAHFYAEGQQPGSGPAAVMDTIQQNFAVKMDYYVRIRFEGVWHIINALDGIDIELSEPMAGYPEGKHHLTGRKALAFIRNRQGSDDFFRMERGQFMMKSLVKNLLAPKNWPRLPSVTRAFFEAVETDIPIWIWPRLGVILLRAGPDGINNHIIPREMATPSLIESGANILMPDWALIHPLVNAIFGN